MTTPPRNVELRWDAGVDGSRRLSAECPDEITTMIFIGPPIFDESDPDALLAGEFGAMLVAEHQSRCSSCQVWQERAS